MFHILMFLVFFVVDKRLLRIRMKMTSSKCAEKLRINNACGPKCFFFVGTMLTGTVLDRILIFVARNVLLSHFSKDCQLRAGHNNKNSEFKKTTTRRRRQPGQTIRWIAEEKPRVDMWNWAALGVVVLSCATSNTFRLHGNSVLASILIQSDRNIMHSISKSR